MAALVVAGTMSCTAHDDPAPDAAERVPVESRRTPSEPETDAGVIASDERRRAPLQHVMAISVDGLSVAAIDALGPTGAPTLHQLLDEGVGTLNARTAYEANITLPNHVGMVTGRRISAARGGHGVTWNTDLPDDTVQGAAGGDIASIFTLTHDAGMTTALFAGKSKFDIMSASWPDAIDHVEIRDHESDPSGLGAAVASHLSSERPALVFWHIAAPDDAGHRSGGMSTPYLDAIRAVDTAIGKLVAQVETVRGLRKHTLVVLTADHGFSPGERDHGARVPANYTIPFVVWGAGVRPGDLYDLNPELSDPGTGRPSYAGPQPVRNLDLALVVTDALGVADPDIPARPLRIR